MVFCEILNDKKAASYKLHAARGKIQMQALIILLSALNEKIMDMVVFIITLSHYHIIKLSH